MNNSSHSNQLKIILAPMAGITDKPFRQLCREMGADSAVSEMISADISLYDSRKTRLRMDFSDESSPRIIQIAGADPVQMARATRVNIDNGAEIIDINMGCPAKKVCNVMAGSALLRDEGLVGKILAAVVAASTVPVTLKIRTGWDPAHRNALRIGQIAQDCGIRQLVVHGRTRACGFTGKAEHRTVALLKSELNMPVIANGDIDSARSAAQVLQETGADGIMVGRAAQGNPWIFREIKQFLRSGIQPQRPTLKETGIVLLKHLQGIYGHYGEDAGVRIARKHIHWYCRHIPRYAALRALVNQESRGDRQYRLLAWFFDECQGQELAA